MKCSRWITYAWLGWLRINAAPRYIRMEWDVCCQIMKSRTAQILVKKKKQKQKSFAPWIKQHFSVLLRQLSVNINIPSGVGLCAIRFSCWLCSPRTMTHCSTVLVRWYMLSWHDCPGRATRTQQLGSERKSPWIFSMKNHFSLLFCFFFGIECTEFAIKSCNGRPRFDQGWTFADVHSKKWWGPSTGCKTMGGYLFHFRPGCCCMFKKCYTSRTSWPLSI